MKKAYRLSTFFGGWAAFLFLSGCAHYHVEVGNNDEVDNPIPAYTGVQTEQAQQAAQKSVLNLQDVYALAVERTETMAITVENLEQAEAQQQQAFGAWLPQDLPQRGQKNWTSGAFAESNVRETMLRLKTIRGAGDSIYLSGSETILSGLNQVAAVQGAQANIDAQRYGIRNTASQLLLNVAQAFYSVLEFQDALQTDQDSRDLTQKISRCSKELGDHRPGSKKRYVDHHRPISPIGRRHSER